MSERVRLSELPRGSTYRRLPLFAIGARYRHIHSKEWRDVTSKYSIAGSCYDALDDCWTKGWVWDCSLDSPPNDTTASAPGQ